MDIEHVMHREKICNISFSIIMELDQTGLHCNVPDYTFFICKYVFVRSHPTPPSQVNIVKILFKLQYIFSVIKGQN